MGDFYCIPSKAESKLMSYPVDILKKMKISSVLNAALFFVIILNLASLLLALLWEISQWNDGSAQQDFLCNRRKFERKFQNSLTLMNRTTSFKNLLIFIPVLSFYFQLCKRWRLLPLLIRGRPWMWPSCSGWYLRSRLSANRGSPLIRCFAITKENPTNSKYPYVV